MQAEVFRGGNRMNPFKKALSKESTAGIIFTLPFTIGFLLFGRFIGSTLFHSTLAGSLILTLAWICPFLYTNSTLVSILNGLGHTASSFFVNTVGLLLGIASVFFLIPLAGIRGYLWGLLGSQLTITLLCLWELFHLLHRNPSV